MVLWLILLWDIRDGLAYCGKLVPPMYKNMILWLLKIHIPNCVIWQKFEG